MRLPTKAELDTLRREVHSELEDSIAQVGITMGVRPITTFPTIGVLVIRHPNAAKILMQIVDAVEATFEQTYGNSLPKKTEFKVIPIREDEPPADRRN